MPLPSNGSVAGAQGVTGERAGLSKLQHKRLTVTTTKARDRAEEAFGKTQTQFLARNRTVSEQDAVAEARDEKTARLRELRLQKEAEAAAAKGDDKV